MCTNFIIMQVKMVKYDAHECCMHTSVCTCNRLHINIIAIIYHTPRTVPHSTSGSGPSPLQGLPRHRPSSSSSKSGPTSPRRLDQDDSLGPQRCWSAGSDKEGEPTLSRMLYDEIQQLSDKIHIELGQSQDDGHTASDPTSSRLDRVGEAVASNLTPEHSLEHSQSISSGNSSPMDDDTSDEDAPIINDTGFREFDKFKDSSSHEIALYSEQDKLLGASNTEEGLLQDGLEQDEGALNITGGNGRCLKNGVEKDGGSGKDGDDVSDSGGIKPHAENIDPKLYKALEKMRKLDKKLANLTKVNADTQ